MGQYAKILGGVVVEVIEADANFFTTFVESEPGEWLEASIDMEDGINKKGGEVLRKNYPGKGWLYNKEEDAFIPNKLYPSWVLDKDKGKWMPPLPLPAGPRRKWNEEKGTWDLDPFV